MGAARERYNTRCVEYMGQWQLRFLDFEERFKPLLSGQLEIKRMQDKDRLEELENELETATKGASLFLVVVYIFRLSFYFFMLAHIHSVRRSARIL